MNYIPIGLHVFYFSLLASSISFLKINIVFVIFLYEGYCQKLYREKLDLTRHCTKPLPPSHKQGRIRTIDVE